MLPMRARVALVALFLPVASHGQTDGSLSLAPALSIETFLTDPATHRADETIVGQMSEVDGTVVTQDVSMTWVLGGELGEDQVVQLTVPLLEVTNLARTHAGYSSATINIPEAFVSVYALGAPEGAVVASIDGVRIEEARWARWPAPMDHPHQPATRFAPFLDWLASLSFASVRVGEVSSDVIGPQGQLSVRHGGVAIGPLKNGRLRRGTARPARIDEVRMVRGPSGAPQSQGSSFSLGAGEVVGANLRPLVELLTGLADPSPEPVLESSRLEHVELRVSPQEMLRLDALSVRGIRVDPSAGPLLPRLDAVLTALHDGGPLDPRAIVKLVYDLAGAISAEAASVDGVSFDAPDGSGRVAAVAVDGVSLAGLDALTLDGLHVETPQRSVTFTELSLEDVRSPARGAVEALFDGTYAGTPVTARPFLDLMTTVGRLFVLGLEVTQSGGPPLRLARGGVLLADYIHPIPTALEVSLVGLEVPAALVLSEPAMDVLRRAAVDALQIDATLALKWNAAKEAIAVSHEVSIAEAGRLMLEGVVAGVPRKVFEDPVAASSVVAGVSLTAFSAGWEDDGLAEHILAIAGQDAARSRGEATNVLVEVLRPLTRLIGAELASTMEALVREYLAEPHVVTVTAQPHVPVPLSQIAAAAITSPETLAELLNMSIETTPQRRRREPSTEGSATPE